MREGQPHELTGALSQSGHRVYGAPGVPIACRVVSRGELWEWRTTGWARMMGRQPGPNDLIVPLPPETIARRTKRTGEPFRKYDYTAGAGATATCRCLGGAPGRSTTPRARSSHSQSTTVPIGTSSATGSLTRSRSGLRSTATTEVRIRPRRARSSSSRSSVSSAASLLPRLLPTADSVAMSPLYLAPEEGFELSADTFDDEPLLRSQQLVFRLVTEPSTGFRTVWQRIGRAA